MRNIPSKLISTPWTKSLTRHIVQFCLCCLLVAVGAPQSSAQLTRVNPVSRIMTNPEVVNLYWDKDWDANHASLTMSTIDSFTTSLLATPYLAGAGQYGVQGASFRGSFIPHHRSGPTSGPLDSGWHCGPPKANGTINVGTLANWIDCEITHSGTGVPLPSGGDNKNTLYVVYLPSPTTIRNRGQYESCDGSAGAFSAFHSSTPLQFVFAVVPLSCNPTLAQLTVSASHEIIESLTDPTGEEWVARGAATPITIGPITIPQDGEAADICTPLPGLGSGGISFFGIQVEAYFSNSAAAAAGSPAPITACVIGNTSVAAFTAPLVISPIAPALLENTATQFSVAPAIPVRWTMTSSVTPSSDTFIGPDGVLHVGRIAQDFIITITATAADGGIRSASTFAKGLVSPIIRPAHASALIGSNVSFHESHGFSVAWTVEGGDENGTIDAGGNYVAPSGGPERNISITATPDDTRRPAAHVTVHFLPYAQLERPGHPMKAADNATLIYGVCSDSQRTTCIAIYPERARVTLSASPSAGRFGDPKSKLRQEYVDELAAAQQEKAKLDQRLKKESFSPQELASFRTKIAELQSDHIAKLKAQIQAIDFTYHAPTLQELLNKGIKPGQSLKVTITATSVDDSGTHKAETELTVVAK